MQECTKLLHDCIHLNCALEAVHLPIGASTALSLSLPRLFWGYGSFLLLRLQNGRLVVMRSPRIWPNRHRGTFTSVHSEISTFPIRDALQKGLRSNERVAKTLRLLRLPS